jgi:translation initiation factor 1
MKRRNTGNALPAEPFHNPFRTLRDKLDTLPSVPPAARSAGSPPRSPLPSKAVLRLERKGRAGKEVTCAELRDLRPADLARWVKELKQQLGCGGSVEGETLVLQGDQRQRLKTLLLQQGVKSVSIG